MDQCPFPVASFSAEETICCRELFPWLLSGRHSTIQKLCFNHHEDWWQLANPEFTGKMAVETVNTVGDMISLLLGPTLWRTWPELIQGS